MRMRRRVLIVAAGLVLVIGVATALGITTFTAVGIEDIQVKTSEAEFSTTSASYVAVPGATATLTVTSGRAVRARFSAESLCGGGGGSVGDECLVKILISGVGELHPSPPEGFAFDSFEANANREAQAMERISNELTAGTYTVRVQARTQNGINFTLDDWTLSAETLPKGIPPG